MAFPYKICKKSEEYDANRRRESVLEIGSVRGIILIRNKNSAENEEARSGK